jgi:predicted acetyltransferase
MSVSVRDARQRKSDRLWIEGIYREYLDDLSPLNTGLFPMLGELGHREPDHIARWFGDPGAVPLVILQSDKPVGFAMVARGGTQRPGKSPTDYRMAEFFVTRSHRRLGIGRSVVPLILDRFAGRWEIVEHLRNSAAVNFWRRVLSAYTGGRYEERVLNGEVHQFFESGAARRDHRSGSHPSRRF